MSDLRLWQSVMKQNKNIGAFRFYGASETEWANYEWILTACPKTIDGKQMYILFEYDETKIPKIGLASICVTEGELDNHFYEDRKVDIN